MERFLRIKHSIFLKIFLSGIILLFVSQQAKAVSDTYTWSGLGGDGNWNNSLNWVHLNILAAGYPGGASQTGDAVNFGEILAGYSVKMGSNITVASVTVLGVATILNPGPVTINTNSNTLTVSGAVSVGQFQVVTLATLPSVITQSALTFSGSGTVAINGSINVYTGGQLSFGTSGGTNPVVKLTGVTISIADFIDTSLLSVASSLLSTLGLTSNMQPTVTNYGTLSIYSSSVINLTGYYSHFVNGGTLNAGANAVFNMSGPNCTLSNSSLFTLSPTGVMNLTSSTGTVANTGTFTLQSNISSSATIGKITAGASFTGKYNVQRSFAKQASGTTADNTRNYRLLSSPVNVNPTGVINDAAATSFYNLQYLNTNSGGLTGIFTAGPGGTASGFSVANATPTIYLYKESVPNSNGSFNGGNFKGLTNIAGSTTVTAYNDAGTVANVNATLYAGNAYMLYYCGNNTVNVTSTTALNKQFRIGGYYIAPDSTTMTAIGTLNQGTIPVKLWWSGSTSLSNVQTGYNLVGNPYASTIDLNTSLSGGIAMSSLSNYVYVFNGATKNYGAYPIAAGGTTGTNNASNLVGSGQGFFVLASSGSAGLTFNETAKSNLQPNVYGATYLIMGLPTATATTQLLRVKLARDTINTDDIMIFFSADSKNAYEKYIDADRMPGLGNISTLASFSTDTNVMLAINHMHSIDSTTRVKLYVNISGSTGIDSLMGTGFDSLDPRYDVYLVDHYKKDSLLFSKYYKYLFNINNADTTTFGANRFEIVFHKKSGLAYQLLSFTGVPVKTGIQLTWRTLNEQNLTGFQIQREDGSKQFISLNSLQSNGAGTYTYIDKTPLAGNNYYRLLQDDAFDYISYSNVISVNVNGAGKAPENIMLYPNPVASQFNVKINTNVPSQVVLKVTNALGQTMINQSMGGDNIQQTASNLLPGSYVVQVIDKGTQKVIGVTKFIKQ